MKIRIFLAVLSCKLSRALLRLLGRGGTDFPGRIALKICPDLLGTLAKNVTTLIVTGTNGKTTTARMIEQSWQASGISFFANKSGANLLSGVTAEFAIHSTLFGKCRHTHALIESDEGALKLISRYVDVKALVVTNVFRDQLDRYGDVTGTLESIRAGVKNSPNAVLVLNADDSLSSTLADDVPNKTVFYGIDVPIYGSRVTELSDAPFCIRCKGEYVYDYVTYGHLGGYRCLHCGYQRPQPQVSVTEVIVSDAEHSEVSVRVGEEVCRTDIHLPGGYNIYNACAAMAAGYALALDAQTVSHAMAEFSCGFGRMEKFTLNGTDTRMILIKNPAGCNQVLNFLAQMHEPFVFGVCLSDHVQDGRDVSWIWDTDFERLCSMDMLSEIYVSGVRAEDMALRFKYAGIEAERLHIIKDEKAFLEAMTAAKKPVFIMPTYTAMLSLRATVSKVYGYKKFWA